MRSSFLSGVVVVVCLFLEIVVGGPNQVVISNPECDAADVVIEDASGTLCNCAAISDLQTRVTELENNNNNGVTYYIGSWVTGAGALGAGLHYLESESCAPGCQAVAPECYCHNHVTCSIPRWTQINNQKFRCAYYIEGGTSNIQIRTSCICGVTYQYPS